MKVEFVLKHDTCEILMTKRFAAEASDPTTEAFSLLCQVRTEYPEYKVGLRTITRNDDKQTYKRLSYGRMRDYLEGVYGSDSAEAMELDRVIALEEGRHKRAYAVVKSWFLKEYPEAI